MRNYPYTGGCTSLSFDAFTVDYYKPDKDHLRKVQPFKDAVFITALEIKTILDELHVVQKQLVRADFMFHLLKQYEQRGFDPNLILELMQRVVPHVFPINIKAAPQETRLYYSRSKNNTDNRTILFGYVEKPKTKVRKKKFSDCPSILTFV
jgi:hypothetical protein